MNLKRYQNEIVVFLAFLLMLGALLYKNGQISVQSENLTNTKQAISNFKEIVSLKKIWANKNTSKKIEKLKELIPKSKVTWSSKSKSKKLTSSYKGLTAIELNKLVTKILELTVEIEKLKIQKTNSSYDVEFKCKW